MPTWTFSPFAYAFILFYCFKSFLYAKKKEGKKWDFVAANVDLIHPQLEERLGKDIQNETH